MWKRVIAAVLTLCFCLCATACNDSRDIDKKVGRFTSYDLYGKEVTESIFAEKDLTILNVWGTFSEPCVEEMPALAKLAEDLPENAQLIALACDIRDLESVEYSKALDIMMSSNAGFKCIITTDSLTVFVDQFNVVPTTLLVDKKGNVIGEPIIGENIAGYKSAAEEYLNGL